MSESVDQLTQQRKAKLAKLRELGVDPYGSRVEGVEPSAGIRDRYIEDSEDQKAKAAGRIVLLRDIGKLIFITLRDSSGTIQIGLSKKRVQEDQWPVAKSLDLGDILFADGQLGRTKTGELTIWAEEIKILSKALIQPPEKFHGLQDRDLRYRQRYVDLWANPEVMQKFKKRSDIIASIRSMLIEKGFYEVETPMMQSIAGGAAAKPFITHHNTLDIDMYLRIAPELYLKRLLVGGFEKVFEINRSYRNEGLSTRHNPEFTMMELYQAYSDYLGMMDITEELVSNIIEKHCEGSKLTYGDMEIDFSTPWRRARYADLLKEYSGCDIDDVEAVRKKAGELGINEAGMDDAVVINEVFEQTVEQHLVNPTFVMDYPAAICPLTKTKPESPETAERFELFCAKMEVGNAYTELNDPEVQRKNFMSQLRGEEDSMAKMDEDFLTALEYGMPPAGGLGIGIDRLIMLLTDSPSIRDVILFPALKPQAENS
ncbi:lysine--tRNA ligase [Sedimentisphaera salicampi]|uniref:lysine--tRNA ligase n=1 Tax=Sedimentisphaera salicampi TaxID=1941349 RepID=UPI000B9BB3E2|nr:lysine--tRNA ligase [Sedimentisphaera salicampi]OXU14343.1 Lysine--tRNA ligase [Sedimentisphaera salicampi]